MVGPHGAWLDAFVDGLSASLHGNSIVDRIKAQLDGMLEKIVASMGFPFAVPDHVVRVKE